VGRTARSRTVPLCDVTLPVLIKQLVADVDGTLAVVESPAMANAPMEPALLQVLDDYKQLYAIADTAMSDLCVPCARPRPGSLCAPR